MIASASLLLSLFVSAAPVEAAQCRPGLDNPARNSHDIVARHVATIQRVSNLTGVQATIREYNPYYSGSNSTGTNATIMLNNGNPNAWQWEQLGWFVSKLHDGIARREIGIEIWPHHGTGFMWWPANAVGTTTRYKILYNPSNHSWDLWAGSTYLLGNNFNDAPVEYQVFGETHDRYDQMPGDPTTKVTFTGLTYFTGANHAAHAMVASFATDDQWRTWYGAEMIPGSQNWRIWDRNCTQ